MTLTGYDAAYPPATPPPTGVVCFYIGGDTPHVWTPQEIAAQTARWRLPIWVRSNPQQVDATTDANGCIAALTALGAPKGTLVVLDLETAQDITYDTTFGNLVTQAGWLVAPYGSASTLFHNPQFAGYWLAAPSLTAIPTNCIGLQMGQGGGGAWDNDLFLDGLPLWDTRPPAPPLPAPLPPPTTDEDEDMADIVVKETGNSRHVFVSEQNSNGSVEVHHWVQAIDGNPNFTWAYEKLGPAPE